MRRVMLVLAVVLVLFAGAQSSTGADGVPPAISGIRVVRLGDALGVEISATAKPAYTCYKMPQLLRVVIDFPRTDPGRPDTLFRVNSDMIATIKLERKTINDVPITRVAVNLSEDADFTEQVDPADGRKLTVFFRKTGAAASSVTPMQMTAAVQAPGPAQPPPPVPLPHKTATTPVVPKANQSVQVGRVDFNPGSIEIQTGVPPDEFRVFTLREPGRMVIDIPAAQTSLSSIAVPSNRFDVVKARIGSFEGKLRMVFDTGQKPFPPCDVLKTATGLRIQPKASAAVQK